MAEKEESNLVAHAKRELGLAGVGDDDADYGGALENAVLQLIRLFESQHHSGASAHMAIGMFEKLARFEPLGPLTGEDYEWNYVGDDADGPVYQNNRCGRVFKQGDGRVEDIEGKVFRQLNGVCFTSRESCVPVTFPYTPKSEIVDVPE